MFQIFEWWYFKKYGTSFIEQLSLNHISPLLGGGADTPNGDVAHVNGNAGVLDYLLVVEHQGEEEGVEV